jgi:hypothetical protein
VHASALERAGITHLNEGQRVSVEVTEGLVTCTASNAVFSLLPVHHRKAAVELRGQLHAFVDVDYTFHRVSRGDQCRSSLQARGL